MPGLQASRLPAPGSHHGRDRGVWLQGRSRTDLGQAGRLRSQHGLTAVLAEDFDVPQDKLDLVLRDVLSYSEVVAVLEEPAIPVRDLADTKVLACALAGRAECIVTGDRDLLALPPMPEVQILTPRAFLDAQR